jgi:hypothetical protein
MSLPSSSVLLLVGISLILPAATSPVLARSWSYHYHPAVVEPTPAPTPAQLAPAPIGELVTAKLLKRAIVADLAIYSQDQEPRSNGAYAEHMKYIVSQLSRFEQINSPEALDVFASLTGYYLGASGERLYECLAPRKGKAVKPQLEQYFQNGNPECLKELGRDFSKPSASLDGYAFCSTSQEQAERLKGLIAGIDNGQSCTDVDSARRIGSVGK